METINRYRLVKYRPLAPGGQQIPDLRINRLLNAHYLRGLHFKFETLLDTALPYAGHNQDALRGPGTRSVSAWKALLAVVWRQAAEIAGCARLRRGLITPLSYQTRDNGFLHTFYFSTVICFSNLL
ncbi:hypothetical protein [Paraburkholderia sp. BL17N1]|uniref:hypothetical protein n=1 Tax=Paraburkholderia sp. BL17N1 TaxID=1938798 RepID=UPI001A7E6CE1|nr:hypothetical protein [Paraburkholderia sp. BL17N1]